MIITHITKSKIALTDDELATVNKLINLPVVKENLMRIYGSIPEIKWERQNDLNVTYYENDENSCNINLDVLTSAILMVDTGIYGDLHLSDEFAEKERSILHNISFELPL